MGKRKDKCIVISAVNFTSGGPLSILIDCLKSIKELQLYIHNEIIVLVHKKELVADFDFCEVYEYPAIKSSWSKRLRFEYLQSKKLSKLWKPDLWISLHDITPVVICPQVVYCHNPSPFYKIKAKTAFYDITFTLFCFFYRYLYRINIKKNLYVIVQQQWLREEFLSHYKVKSIVAYPQLPKRNQREANSQTGEKFVFIYPAFARVAKNFDVLLEAALILSKKRKDFEIWLTISGTDNKYAQMLYDRYNNIESVKFLGNLSRNDVFDLYAKSSALVFPSELETWGLPITEYFDYKKPMLLSHLKYAHETAGDYPFVKYFDQTNAGQLSYYMELLMANKLVFDFQEKIIPDSPFCRNWNELLNILFAIA